MIGNIKTPCHPQQYLGTGILDRMDKAAEELFAPPLTFYKHSELEL